MSPDGPDHFPVVFAKTVAMIDTEPEIDLATLAGSGAETLVLQGDRDEVTVEHSMAVARAIPECAAGRAARHPCPAAGEPTGGQPVVGEFSA